DLGGAAARHLLAIRPAPELLTEGAPLTVTLLTEGPDPLPRDAVVDWRLSAPGDDPSLPMPWRKGPPLTNGIAILTAPPLPVAGRWTLEAQARSDARVFARADAVLHVVRTLEGSQQSFALLGDAPVLREAYGAWIIPAEYAPQTVVVHPALER